MARRYGQLPSDLIKSSLEDYIFNHFIMTTALEDEHKRTEKARHGK